MVPNCGFRVEGPPKGSLMEPLLGIKGILECSSVV